MKKTAKVLILLGIVCVGGCSWNRNQWERFIWLGYPGSPEPMPGLGGVPPSTVGTLTPVPVYVTPR